MLECGSEVEQIAALLALVEGAELRRAQLVGVVGRDLSGARGPRARQMERARLVAEDAEMLAGVDLDLEPQGLCRRDLGLEAIDDEVVLDLVVGGPRDH